MIERLKILIPFKVCEKDRTAVPVGIASSNGSLTPQKITIENS